MSSKCSENGGETRRGRARLRWEICVKRDLERVGREWRTTTKELASVDRERREREKSEERKKDEDIVTNVTPDDRDIKRRHQRWLTCLHEPVLVMLDTLSVRHFIGVEHLHKRRINKWAKLTKERHAHYTIA